MSEMLDRLRRLAAIWGPAGREQKVAEAIEELIAPFVDEAKVDRFGNLIATKRGAGGGKRLMLTAHMDSPGAIALNVGEKGLIYLGAVGPMKAHHALGQRVVWGSGATGVIQHESAEEAKEIDFKRLFCDIGATSRAEALENVALGDICTLVADFQQMDDLVVAPALDARAGCAVLLEVAEHLAETEHEVAFVFTSQGHLGPRGAGPAAYGVAPDLAVVVDTTPAGDLPHAPRTAPSLGSGPAVRLKAGNFMAHQGLTDLVQAVAGEHAIPLQVTVTAGNTEAQLVATAGSGVPTAVVDLPIRYAGTAAEMVNLRDLYGAADLLLKLLANPLEG